MSLLLSDNFDDNDITDWTTTGTISASGGKATAALGAANWAYQDFAQQSEVWASFKKKYTWTSWGSGVTSLGTGIRNSVYGKLLTFQTYTPAATVILYVDFYEEGGDRTTSTSVEIVSGTEYHFKLHWKKAASTSSNDGVIQLWILSGGIYSGEKVFEKLDVDNGVISDRFSIGENYADPITGSFTVDDLLVGTTEGDVYTAGATITPGSIWPTVTM